MVLEGGTRHGMSMQIASLTEVISEGWGDEIDQL